MSQTTFELKEGRHFTPSGLLSYLNKNYAYKIPTNKKSVWNINDIHQYLLPNRCLPLYINGKNKLTEIEIFGGIRIIELEWLQ